MKLQAIKDIVALISYKPGWHFIVGQTRKGEPYIQIAVTEEAEAARCAFTGDIASWKGGKRTLSFHMCKQEIVGACLDAIKTAEMHEMHEYFRYRGRAIFNPHLDPDALYDIATLAHMNMRANAMTMEE
jgi:hypothetical protein